MKLCNKYVTYETSAQNITNSKSIQDMISLLTLINVRQANIKLIFIRF